MTTLSQIVNEIVSEILRPDMIPQLTTFVNLTIRELHTDPKSGLAIGFAENLTEVQLTASQDTGYVYEIPNPELLQFVEAVWFRRGGRLAELRKPSTINQYMASAVLPAAYYRTGPAIAFAGYGGTGGIIDVALSYYPRGLKYYPSGAPAVWNEDTESWNYAPAYDSTPELQAQARRLCTNWIMARHKELVKQGAIAKFYARAKDTDRARLAYSLYEQIRPGFVSAESYERGTIYRP